jgi:hypothetical protein
VGLATAGGWGLAPRVAGLRRQWPAGRVVPTIALSSGAGRLSGAWSPYLASGATRAPITSAAAWSLASRKWA